MKKRDRQGLPTAEHPGTVERLTALADSAREDLGDYDRIGGGVRFFDDGPKWPRRQEWIK